MGKCVEKLHFLRIGWISRLFAQAKLLIICILKKSVSLVPLVPTVSFGPATLVFEAQGVEKVKESKAKLRCALEAGV